MKNFISKIEGYASPFKRFLKIFIKRKRSSEKTTIKFLGFPIYVRTTKDFVMKKYFCGIKYFKEYCLGDLFRSIEQNRAEQKIRDEIFAYLDWKRDEIFARVDWRKDEICARVDWEVDLAKNEICEFLKTKIDTATSQRDIMFWQVYAKICDDKISQNKVENQNLKLKELFFLGLPKATGGLRLIQKGNAYLLKNLRKICNENGLKYWLDFGTLLGAVRHKGCIPWDDDVDVSMMRDDMERLFEILKDNEEFKITLVYDFYAKNRQVRFRFRNEEIPCFVDIFLYDFWNDLSEVAYTKFLENRENLIRELECIDTKIYDYWERQPLLESTDNHASEIKEIFDKYIQSTTNTRVDNFNSIIYAIDNFDGVRKSPVSKEMFFPLSELEYEKEKYFVPKEYMVYLERQYGDIYKLPNDLITHSHISTAYFKSEYLKNSLLKLLEKE